jgi:hypothetical protein
MPCYFPDLTRRELMRLGMCEQCAAEFDRRAAAAKVKGGIRTVDLTFLCNVNCKNAWYYLSHPKPREETK